VHRHFRLMPLVPARVLSRTPRSDRMLDASFITVPSRSPRGVGVGLLSWRCPRQQPEHRGLAPWQRVACVEKCARYRVGSVRSWYPPRLRVTGVGLPE
jgi:hypothetical protein